MSLNKILFCGVGIFGAFNAYIFYRNKTQDVYSYHITKVMSEREVFWWPLSGFNQYCTDKSYALNVIKKYIKNDPDNKYKLYEFKAVTDGYYYRTVVGIENEGKLIFSSSECHKNNYLK